MARIRTVKPELFRHETLYEAEVKTNLPLRLAYIGLFTACDREGRFKWKPRALKLDVLPYDQIDFSRVLDALVTHGFIVKYQFEDNEFGCIPTWSQHQVINNRESTSLLPSFEESTTCTPEARVVDASLTPLVRTQGEGEGKGREGKGNKERKAPKVAATVVACPHEVQEQVWQDWLTLRKMKKAPVTETVVLSAQKEATKANMSFNDFLVVWCRRGSQGLEANWLKPHERQSFAQQAADIARTTVPAQHTGPDPVLLKIEADRKKATPMPAHIREQINSVLRKA